ncbi:MAG: TatD family hydrolase [Oscillatoria sp. PMC 1051.18]|nr:TatD family hydrolase [Oscillatoria sp. PMC 1050.18]MEC5028292.1 TatD family hydrolase [Oscillatoria sp. PMC 1051.18]
MANDNLIFIDPHIHMTSRTTYDYLIMREYGIVAVIEPSFWLGQPRTTLGSFKDYFSTLVGWERFRASQFGIKHYCTIGLNPKEANNAELAEQVMELLPLYACKEGVVAIGEIGYDDMTETEDKYFRQQLELAKELDTLVLIHTPHRNKKAGASRSMDRCLEHGLDPSQVIIDHNNEETVEEVINRGFWAAFTIYPMTKMGNARMVEVVRKYGKNRIIVDSSADWGVSDPLAVPKTAKLMLEKGITEDQVRTVCYENALAAYSQTGQMQASDWSETAKADQSQLYDGNSVLRGQKPGIESVDDFLVIE